MGKGMTQHHTSIQDSELPTMKLPATRGSQMNTMLSILRWHAAARPIPSQIDASATLGCHFEEITEMADALLLCPMTDDFEHALIEFIKYGQDIADRLKRGVSGIDFFDIEHHVRLDLIDSYMDQLVTVIGSAYTQNYDVLGAAEEVNRSNWSKFDLDGNPIYDENKKVRKGPQYSEAVLDSFVLDVVMSIPQEKETTQASMENTMQELIQVSTNASYEELRDAQDRLTAQIEARRGEARAEGVAKIVSLVHEFGITAEELNKALTGKIKSGKGKNKGTGKTAAPKYRDPATGSTWTGRGVAPAWIKDFAKEDRAQFLIASEGASSENAPAGVPVSNEAVPVMDTAPAAEAETAVTETAPVFGNTPVEA